MKKQILVLCLVLTVALCHAQQGAGIFLGPQLTVFEPANTINFNKNYFRFDNPQLDIHAGVFASLELKNNWFLNLDLGAGSKTYMMDNYTIGFPDGYSTEQVSQSITDWEIKIGIGKRFLVKQWEFQPSLSALYAFNIYNSVSESYSSGIYTDNDSLTTNQTGSDHLGYQYNSLGLGAGVEIGYRKPLQHFWKILNKMGLKMTYMYELALLPQEEYNIQASQGTHTLNQTFKWQGRFSYINFDVMYFIFRHKEK